MREAWEAGIEKGDVWKNVGRNNNAAPRHKQRPHPQEMPRLAFDAVTTRCSPFLLFNANINFLMPSAGTCLVSCFTVVGVSRRRFFQTRLPS